MLGRLGLPITILLAAVCFACVSVFQSSFSSRFSLEELVKRNQPNSGLNCSTGGGGGSGSGIGTGAGGIGGTQSTFHKGESFSCQISDAAQFDEAGFLQALKATVEKDLTANDAKITSSNNTDATRFSVDYVMGSTSGRLEISGTRVPGGYYSFNSTLNEKSGS